ncbi:hypothetical protein FRY98_27370 [Paenibacillus faecis]|uniref:Uncharacterized protein n=1 Tax=Paenibacillus faecis TaxID=862114 RepID=A0A5D0CKG1_9BACL|nr:hypothetical protein [Paenibacillus faecis]TYA10301.1 hypothetical protein FRY98_27370 [Paenibacillus faecis]
MKRMDWLLPTMVAAGLLLASCSPTSGPGKGLEGARENTSLSMKGSAQQAEAQITNAQKADAHVKQEAQGGASETPPAAQQDKRTPGAFNASRNADGALVAVPAGLKEDYFIDNGAIVELEGETLVMANVFSGDEGAVKVMLSHKPGEAEVKTVWSETITDTNNPWYNAFIRQLLVKLDETRVLFLEPEMTNNGGKFHLSEFNARTGEITRIREDFWPLNEKGDYDYIYQYRWDGGRKKLFLQSYLGLVRVFDLRGGKDEAPERLFRVIPHSTTGAPSLFPSPDLERFVHDDESGQVTFYKMDGTPLGKIKLPADKYVPSEKLKWNPAGSIAWMESSPEGQGRIKDIDIDYLSIAPQRIDFYDKDGKALGSLRAEAGDDRALDIVSWLDASTAHVKSYRIVPDGNDTYGIDEKGAAFFTYDVLKKKKRSADGTEKAEAQVIAEQTKVIVGPKEIVFSEK